MLGNNESIYTEDILTLLSLSLFYIQFWIQIEFTLWMSS